MIARNNNNNEIAIFPESGSVEAGVQGTPDALPHLVLHRDIKKVQAEIKRVYGFEPTLRYCADLIAFVDAMTVEFKGNGNANGN